MLTLSEIRTVLNRITYKPGWDFQVTEHPREGHLLRIEVDVPDSQHGGSIRLGINTWMPPMPNTWYVVTWLMWRIRRIEMHEVAEFLKLDSAVVDDPHSGECPWLEATGKSSY